MVCDEPDSDEEREKVAAANKAAADKAKEDGPKKVKAVPMTEQERRQMKE